MELTLTILHWVIYACFTVAGIAAVVRIVRGPSIVDRVVGSDTLATILICALSADMAINGHTTTLPLVLGLAMTASVGTMAVARFVSRDRPRANYAPSTEPLQAHSPLGVPDAQQAQQGTATATTATATESEGEAKS